MNWLARFIGKKKVEQLGFPTAISLILLAGMGAIFLQFGPVLMNYMLTNRSPEPPKSESEFESEKIKMLKVENTELEIALLNKLNDKLKAAMNSHSETGKQTQAPPKSYKVDISNEVSPKKQDKQIELKQAPRKELPTTNPFSISNDIQVILIFEDQAFELCGYQGFSAKVTKATDGKQAIKIHSMDRNIPNRSFRGYDKIVHINQMVELWPNCSAAFEYESLASTNRIVISYLRR